MMRWPATLLTMGLAAALCADPATAKITTAGIAGLDVGMSEAAVRSAVGDPSAVSAGEPDGTVLLDYRRRKLDVLLRGGSVIRMRTTSRAEATSSGVGPGTSERTMRRKVRGERCATARRAHVCWLVRGRTVLTFSCRHGRVTMAEVARAES
jgi:hypothetical protein